MALVGIMAALPEPAVAAPAVNWQYRSDWPGDPYLVTNSPNTVTLVLNPDLFAANPDYQNKVIMLAATVGMISDNAFPLVNNLTRQAITQAKARATGHSVTDTLRTSTLANNAADSLPRQPESEHFWPAFFLNRWALFIVVVFFLARRIWRYFQDVEEEDDFADHLSSLAVAHRWIFPVYLALLAAVAAAEFFHFGNLFFSLSILMLASALRRYYCDGDFADYPTAQKIHFASCLLLAWLGWAIGPGNYLANAAIWFQLPVFLWMLLALVNRTFSRFYNDEDFASHRTELYWFGTGFLVLALLGGATGYRIWLHYPTANFLGFIVGGALVACLPLVAFFHDWAKRTGDGIMGKKIFDMIFSEREFAEKTKKKKRLPEILLLQHWREHGEVEKAWTVAQGHLFKEARALSVWMFAMETAILYRHKPGEALEILRQLCNVEDFHYDHRRVAVAQVQGWMAAAGFRFDPASFKIERPPLAPSTMTNKVEALCRAGRFTDAEKLLLEILVNDSLNESAFTQLVRLCAQDLKNRPAAEKLIDDASETFSPKLLEFLKNSLDEWMQAPNRSTVKRRSLLGQLLRRQPADPTPRKLTLHSHHKPARPQPEDPLDAYVERLKESQAKNKPDTSEVHDPVEKLLLECRFGTAVELLKEQAEAAPANFDLWLRYAEAHGNHCGQIPSAEKIIRRMERSGHFKKAQIKKAYTQLAKWRKKHPQRLAGW